MNLSSSIMTNKYENYQVSLRKITDSVTHHAKINLFVCFLVFLWASFLFFSVSFEYDEVPSLEIFYTGVTGIFILIGIFGFLSICEIKAQNWSNCARNILYFLHIVLSLAMVWLVWFSSGVFQDSGYWTTPEKVRDNTLFQIKMAICGVYFIYGAIVPSLALLESVHLYVIQKMNGRRTGDLKVNV